MAEPQRQARDLWRRRPRGRRGGLSLYGAGKGGREGLAGLGRGGLGYLAGMPADRPGPLQGQDGAGRRYVPPAPLAVLQEDADRPRLRRQAECAGLHGLFGQTDRRLAQEFNVLGPDHALGGSRWRGSEIRRAHSISRPGTKLPLIELPRLRPEAGPVEASLVGLDLVELGLGITAPHQPHQLLLGALIVAEDIGALLRHRTGHLLGGCAGRGSLANVDVVIAHDWYPSLDWDGDNAQPLRKVAGCSTESAGTMLWFTTGLAAVQLIQQTKVKNLQARVEPAGRCGRLISK